MIYLKEVRLEQELPVKSYLHQVPAIRAFAEQKRLVFQKNVTFLIGENGTGKSTLLEAIAVALGFNPEGGTKNFSFSTKSTHSELWQHLTLAREKHALDGFFLRAESFYNTASYIDEVQAEQSYGGVSLHKQSHGESFLSLVQNRFSGKGLYLLDEPEAALSPMGQLTLLAEIHRLVGQHSQFLIATHSPILMAYPGAEILSLSDQGILPVRYEETEHYQVTKAFLEHPERMLRELLEG